MSTTSQYIHTTSSHKPKHGFLPLSSGEIAFYTQKDETLRRRQRLLQVRAQEKKFAQLGTKKYRKTIQSIHSRKAQILQKQYIEEQIVFEVLLQEKYTASIQARARIKKETIEKVEELITQAHIESKKWEKNVKCTQKRHQLATNQYNHMKSIENAPRVRLEENLIKLKELSEKNRHRARLQADKRLQMELEQKELEKLKIKELLEKEPEIIIHQNRPKKNDIDAYRYSRLHCENNGDNTIERLKKQNLTVEDNAIKVILHNTKHPTARSAVNDAIKFRTQLAQRQEEQLEVKEKNEEQKILRGTEAMESVLAHEEGEKAVQWLAKRDFEERRRAVFYRQDTKHLSLPSNSKDLEHARERDFQKYFELNSSVFSEMLEESNEENSVERSSIISENAGSSSALSDVLLLNSSPLTSSNRGKRFSTNQNELLDSSNHNRTMLENRLGQRNELEKHQSHPQDVEDGKRLSTQKQHFPPNSCASINESNHRRHDFSEMPAGVQTKYSQTPRPWSFSSVIRANSPSRYHDSEEEKVDTKQKGNNTSAGEFGSVESAVNGDDDTTSRDIKSVPPKNEHNVVSFVTPDKAGRYALDRSDQTSTKVSPRSTLRNHSVMHERVQVPSRYDEQQIENNSIRTDWRNDEINTPSKHSEQAGGNTNYERHRQEDEPSDAMLGTTIVHPPAKKIETLVNNVPQANTREFDQAFEGDSSIMSSSFSSIPSSNSFMSAVRRGDIWLQNSNPIRESRSLNPIQTNLHRQDKQLGVDNDSTSDNGLYKAEQLNARFRDRFNSICSTELTQHNELNDEQEEKRPEELKPIDTEHEAVSIISQYSLPENVEDFDDESSISTVSDIKSMMKEENIPSSWLDMQINRIKEVKLNSENLDHILYNQSNDMESDSKEEIASTQAKDVAHLHAIRPENSFIMDRFISSLDESNDLESKSHVPEAEIAQEIITERKNHSPNRHSYSDTSSHAFATQMRFLSALPSPFEAPDSKSDISSIHKNPIMRQSSEVLGEQNNMSYTTDPLTQAALQYLPSSSSSSSSSRSESHQLSNQLFGNRLQHLKYNSSIANNNASSTKLKDQLHINNPSPPRRQDAMTTKVSNISNESKMERERREKQFNIQRKRLEEIRARDKELRIRQRLLQQ